MALTVRRHYVNVDDRQTHYRRVGEGPAVVMLHNGPRSSSMYESLMLKLADRFTLIAVDRAGFGRSDALDIGVPAISDYAASLRSDVDALGLDGFTLYGRSIGAAIGAEFGVQNPGRLDHLIVDNATITTAEQSAYNLANYPPRFEPTWDGSHLNFLWTVAHDIYVFAPWCRRELAARRRTGMPQIDEVQSVFIDLLHAGDAGHVAYEALFRNRIAETIAKLNGPATVVFHAPPDPPIPLADGVQSVAPLPANTVWQGNIEQTEELVATYSGASDAPLERDAAALPGRISRTYVELDGRQIHLRQRVDASGRPLVMLHSSPFASGSLETLASELATSRPVFAPDLPGHGGSDDFGLDAPSIETYADIVLQLIRDRLGLDEFDLYGTGGGSLVAIEAARRAPKHVRRLILDAVPMFREDERDRVLAEGLPSLEPRWDGSHVTAAWYALRTGALFFPWFTRTVESIVLTEPPEPSYLHQLLVEMLESVAGCGEALAAALAYDVRKNVSKLPLRPLVSAKAGHPLGCVAAEIADLANAESMAALPGSGAEVSALYERYLDDRPA
jgi:pimeloyl-ACP methyl ester carboxylesterase